jgi:hypothetical protein
VSSLLRPLGSMRTCPTSPHIRLTPATIPNSTVACLPLSPTPFKETIMCLPQGEVPFIVGLLTVAWIGLLATPLLILLLLGWLHGLRVLLRSVNTLRRSSTGPPMTTSFGCCPALEQGRRSPGSLEPAMGIPTSSTDSSTWASWIGRSLSDLPLLVFALFASLQPWDRNSSTG